MKRNIQTLLLRWKNYIQEKKKYKSFINHDLLEIRTRKSTSIILSCFGFISDFGTAKNSRGTRSVTWNNVIIVNETKSISLEKRLNNLFKEWVKSGIKSLDDFMNLKALKLSDEVSKVLIKFRLAVKKNEVTVDLLDELGTIIFRGLKKNIDKYANFIAKSKKKRKLLIEEMNKRIATKSNKYNPKNAIEKGFNDIPVSKNGTSPDFAGLKKYLYKGNLDFGKVRIKVTGCRDLDFAQCLKQMGLDKTPKGYTWHHLDDLDENLECTMQLVRSDAHKATYNHLGSALQFQELFNISEKYL